MRTLCCTARRVSFLLALVAVQALARPREAQGFYHVFAPRVGLRAYNPYAYYPWYNHRRVFVPSTAYAPLSYGYNPYVGVYSPYTAYANPAGYLNGSANIMAAQGQFMIANQQAQLLQQQVQQEKLANQRRVFDEWLYEKANTPTLEQIRQQNLQAQTQRSLSNPPITEITSGRALNLILADLQKQPATGPDIPLEPSVLKQINVTANRSGAGIGPLRNDGRLQWPVGLSILPPEDETRALRQQLDAQTAEAIKQAIKGQVDASLITGMNQAVSRLRELLRADVLNQPTMQYIDARSYLGDLSSAIQVLAQPGAGNYFNGTFAARGDTVQQLVSNMAAQGLQFAAAAPGEEAAYLALQRAMAAYASGTVAQR
jgi:hypothetical protein